MSCSSKWKLDAIKDMDKWIEIRAVENDECWLDLWVVISGKDGRPVTLVRSCRHKSFRTTLLYIYIYIYIYITNTIQRAVLSWSILHYIHEKLLDSPELCRWGVNYSIHFDRKRIFSSTLQWTPYHSTDCDIYSRYEYYGFYVISPTDNRMFNPLTPELNPSAQRCLTRFFTGDFASWTVHFVYICVKNQQIHQLFIQFIYYVW
jgi:hypothetical protein